MKILKNLDKKENFHCWKRFCCCWHIVCSWYCLPIHCQARLSIARIQSHPVMFLIMHSTCLFLWPYYILFLNIVCIHSLSQTLWTHHHEWTNNQFSFSLSPHLFTQLIARHLSTMTRYHLIIGSIKCECTFLFHLPQQGLLA